jgi:hypothetical protein
MFGRYSNTALCRIQNCKIATFKHFSGATFKTAGLQSSSIAELKSYNATGAEESSYMVV